MENITAEQEMIISELKSRTIDHCTPKLLEDISVFYRFAKARDFNLKEAETMLRNHLAWRKEVEIDTILTDYKPPEVLLKYMPTTFICFDKKGSLVRYSDCGRLDLKGMWSCATATEISKYTCYVLEQDKERMIKSGRNLGTLLYTAIYDFENLSYLNAVSIKNLQLILSNLKMFIDNYPETIKLGAIINAPRYFAWIYAAIKRILPENVAKKVRVYDTDGWKDDLLELIDAGELPAFLGGNRTDPDGNPHCKTFIKSGQPIPKSYHISKRHTKSLFLEDDVDKLTVLPLSKKEISFKVTEMNSYLEWEFQTKNGDIDFSIVFAEEYWDDFEFEQIIPKQRIDPSDEPEKGCFRCENVGNYTIIFDNSYSWLRLKEVYYRARIQVSKNEDIFHCI